MNQKTLLVFLLIFLLSWLATNGQNLYTSTTKGDLLQNEIKITSILEEISPLQIRNNSDFLAQAITNGWVGDGTENNPLMIQNYLITGSSGVLIAEVDLYFEITNVKVIIEPDLEPSLETLSHVQESIPESAFLLLNSSNGKISNSEAIVNDLNILGFATFDSTHLEFTNNIASNARTCFAIGRTNDTLLQNNIANNCVRAGFQVLVDSFFNTLINNTSTGNGEFGFHVLRFSKNNTLINNTATENGDGFFVGWSSSNNTLIDNTAENNQAHGFTIHQSLGESNYYNQLINNTATNNRDGFDSNSAISTSFTGNVAKNNIVGFDIFNSDETTFYHNFAEENEIGLKLSSSDFTIIQYNEFQSNFESGIEVHSGKNNTINLNNFVNNGQSAFQGPNVLISTDWDNEMLGNYWSDYQGIDENNDGIGDTPYVINADTNGIDNFPIMEKIEAVNNLPEFIPTSKSPSETSLTSTNETSDESSGNGETNFTYPVFLLPLVIIFARTRVKLKFK